MSHPGHPDDTLFIVVEPDFRFYKKEAESQRSEYEREAAAGCRYDDWLELKDALPKEHQASFQRDFGRWATAQADDQNAPWPADAETVNIEPENPEDHQDRGRRRWSTGARCAPGYTLALTKRPCRRTGQTASARSCKTFVLSSARPPARAAAASCGQAGTHRNGAREQRQLASRARPAARTWP